MFDSNGTTFEKPEAKTRAVKGHNGDIVNMPYMQVQQWERDCTFQCLNYHKVCARFWCKVSAIIKPAWVAETLYNNNHIFVIFAK